MGVLATSREPLRVDGEMLSRLGPLDRISAKNLDKSLNRGRRTARTRIAAAQLGYATLADAEENRSLPQRRLL